MLKQRILTAVLLVILFSLGVFYLSPLALWMASGVVMLLAAYEWAGLMKLVRWQFKLIYVAVLGYLGLITLYLFDHFVLSQAILFLSVGVFWLLMTALVLTYPKSAAVWNKKWYVRSVMGYFTLVPCWIAFNLLRNQSVVVLLMLLVPVWLGDATAYFAGRRYGVNKLLPEVSPGKSWQGLAAALLGVIVFAWLVLGGMSYFSLEKTLTVSQFIWLPLWLAMMYIVAVIGDLFESMLKREARIKDSGVLLPGHGGILDRIDSLTSVLPVAYSTVYWVYYLRMAL